MPLQKKGRYTQQEKATANAILFFLVFTMGLALVLGYVFLVQSGLAQ